jgi:hypothetical protein
MIKLISSKLGIFPFLIYRGTIDPFANLAASRVNQGGNLVNLDANSLGSRNVANDLAEQNAIKNPFASKMGGNNSGNRFQWDSNKPNPNATMSLAELAQGKSTLPNTNPQGHNFGGQF